MLTHEPPVPVSRSKGASRATIVRRMASALAICAAVVCFWRAAPPSWTESEAAQASPGSPKRGDSAIAGLQTELSPTSVAGGPASRQLLTRPIRDIRPGMRVLANNPELSGEELPDAAIDPDSWRLVKLHLTKADGSALHMQLLRPRDWLAVYALDALITSNDPIVGLPRPLIVGVDDAGLADVLLGRTIEVDLPELGAEGPAIVQAIKSCPPIETASGSGRRIATGTFRHTTGNVIDISVEGLQAPIGTTDNHPFWSEDRQAFVRAGELRVGERLRRADRQTARVISVVPRAGVQEVYNLEVDAEHVYCVGADGILVHNQYHHFWTRWLGSNVAYGKRSGILTNLSTRVHTVLHSDLADWLRKNHPDMMHASGYGKKQILAQFPDWTDRVKVLEEFFTQYRGGQYLGAFKTEVLQTLFSGDYQ